MPKSFQTRRRRAYRNRVAGARCSRRNPSGCRCVVSANAALDSYRAALNKQLLTPAPDVASVNWKRRELKSYGVKKELVEKVIADDIAFLDAHPTRTSRANKLG